MREGSSVPSIAPHERFLSAGLNAFQAARVVSSDRQTDGQGRSTMESHQYSGFPIEILKLPREPLAAGAPGRKS
jgi:hypothetical protein